MTPRKRIRQLFFPLLLLLAMLSSTAGEAPVTLRWVMVGPTVAPDHSAVGTRAVLRLTNHGAALPSQGWSLYFNCAAEARLGEMSGHWVVEHAGGTLFRMRPTEGFPGVPTGASVDLPIEHAEWLVKPNRAPLGPYLVFDDHPDEGLTIRDYAMQPVTPTQLSDPRVQHAAGYESATQRYADNARLSVLPERAVPPVLPTPQQWSRRDGRLPIRIKPAVVAAAELAPERALVVKMFAALPKPHHLERPVSVTLSVDSTLQSDSDEAYSLDTDPITGIRITGRTATGVARAVASLQQLIHGNPAARRLWIPVVSLRDAPRFAYRGLQIDVARNFQRKEVVFHILDLMARHKLNVLHLHLTDDEGWRIDIADLPELTRVGARRGHRQDPLSMLPPAHGSGPDPEDPHGSGYYTADDYIAILKYAASLRIEVIPEIEMPGHARAAVKAMQARYRVLKASDSAAAGLYLLNDSDDQSRYVSAQGFTDNVMNPAMESTYRFIERVIGAMVELHDRAGVPLRTIHLGGDELPRGAWTASPAVMSLMQHDGLADRQAVWDRFYERVGAIADAKHLRVAGWEEIAARRSADGVRLEPNPRFVPRAYQAYVWNDLHGAEDLGVQLANAGYPTILAPVTAYYFDMAHSANAEEPGATWAPALNLEAGFRFDPMDYPRQLLGSAEDRAQLSTAGAHRIAGLEGTLWSETMREPSRMEYLLLPRLLGLAERAWAAAPPWAVVDAKSRPSYGEVWNVFMNQVSRVALPALDRDQAAAYRIPAPGLQIRNNQIYANHEYVGMTLRYATDGRDPTRQSRRYDGPIPYHDGVSVAAFDQNDRRGHVARAEQ